MAMKFVKSEYRKSGQAIDNTVVVGFKGKSDEKVSYTLLTDSPESCKFLNQHGVLPIVTSVGRVKLHKAKKGLEPTIESLEIYSNDELKEMVEDVTRKTRERFEKEGRLEDYENNEYMLKQQLFEAYKMFNIAFGRQKSSSTK
jgi:hypothetical protein